MTGAIPMTDRELAARLVIASDILKRHPCEVVGLQQDCLAAAEALRRSPADGDGDPYAKDVANWCQRELDEARGSTGRLETRPFVQNADLIIKALRAYAFALPQSQHGGMTKREVEFRDRAIHLQEQLDLATKDAEDLASGNLQGNLAGSLIELAEEGICWRRVNDEPFEYAIQQGEHGDEFVKLFSGTCLRRPIRSPAIGGRP